ncbi:hypothetical protein Tco_0512574, partial [Tanacetum coccineum]
MNVHARAEGAKKHAAALRQLMMDIVSAPLSSQTWVGEASISVAPLFVEDYIEEDTDETLGSVVAAPFPNDSVTLYGPSYLGPSFPPSLAWLASLLRSKFISKASSFFVGSTSAVRSVGMPISAGMTASVPYVSENGVSPLLDFIMAKSANNVVPYELLHLIARDSRNRFCFNPFGEVVNSYDQELDFVWSLREGSGYVDPSFIEWPQRLISRPDSLGDHESRTGVHATGSFGIRLLVLASR